MAYVKKEQHLQSCASCGHNWETIAPVAKKCPHCGSHEVSSVAVTLLDSIPTPMMQPFNAEQAIFELVRVGMMAEGMLKRAL